MSTEIEFYQRLSEHIPEEAARLIAERMTDRPLEAKVDAFESKFDAFESKVDAQFDAVTSTLAAMNAKMDTFATKLEVERLRSSFFRWSLTFFVPLWIGTYGTLVAIVVRGAP